MAKSEKQSDSLLNNGLRELKEATKLREIQEAVAIDGIAKREKISLRQANMKYTSYSKSYQWRLRKKANADIVNERFTKHCERMDRYRKSKEKQDNERQGELLSDKNGFVNIGTLNVGDTLTIGSDYVLCKIIPKRGMSERENKTHMMIGRAGQVIKVSNMKRVQKQ